MFDMTREDKVNEFNEACDFKKFEDNPTGYALVINCIAEESKEFFEAASDYRLNPCKETRANICKEWADLQYVVSQAAVHFRIPADPAFNRVHENNMTKVIDGKVVKRDDGKVLKPEGYKPTDMTGL